MKAPHFHLLTIFPEIFTSFIETSLIGKACQAGQVIITRHDIRTYADPPHYKVDDYPYGGGPGMVMLPEPLARCVEAVKQTSPAARVVLPSPAGTPFNQRKAEELAQAPELIFVCGRYEGIDQRFIDGFVDEEISLGDYILMGGEVPVMAILESIIRLIPEVLGNETSIMHESFCVTHHGSLLLEAPQFTKPAQFRGSPVPEVLVSGNHKKVAEWRHEQSLALTKQRRPELLKMDPSTGKRTQL